MDASIDHPYPKPRRLVRWVAIASFVVSVIMLVVAYGFFTARFSTSLANQSALRAAFYSGNIKSVLQRHLVVPLLLSQDPSMVAALQSGDYTNTTARLINYSEEVGAASIFMLDINGRVVAGSDRLKLGKMMRTEQFFIRSLREQGTVFNASSTGDNAYRFYFSKKITSGSKSIGIIVIEVNLRRQEEIWRNLDLQVALTSSEGDVLLSSNTRWRARNLQSILEENRQATSGLGVLSRIDLTPGFEFVNIGGQRLLVSEASVGFRGWTLHYFASTQNVSARVNAVLALAIMGLAILVSVALYLVSRRTARESAEITKESRELRSLNARLSDEVAQRQKAERNLQSAEQNLEQASKLAALGQMSAAVSHELNQPLAAMRTYIAGARLLLKRDRLEETETSFQRIDDLITRMGAITRQLKSYSRKSGTEAKKIDLRDCLAAALAIMGPQIGRRGITFVQDIPDQPAWILSEQVRVEQIIINLVRNALDAVQEVTEPRVEISLKIADDICLTIKDNGHGFEDPESLFEPFYTTKKPGEGVGLGLAISAGIATEMGGRLVARNATPLGAIFEFHIPKYAGTQSEKDVM